MDAQGGIAFGAFLKPSNTTSIWYQPRGGTLVKAFVVGDAAPGTMGASNLATFSDLDSPNMGSAGTFAFYATFNATAGSDNAAGNRGSGIWRGSVAGGFASILRVGDTNAPRAGLGLPNASSKVGYMFPGWLNNLNHGGWLAFVDVAGDGVGGADPVGPYTDISGTMNLLIKGGDAAPGMPVGATMFSFDSPVLGGATGNEYLAFIGKVSGGGTTIGVNNKGIWRSKNGAAPALVIRTGDTMNTTQGQKIIADVDFPGSNDPDHTWEQPVMDATGRLLVFVTFTDGTTSQVLVP